MAQSLNEAMEQLETAAVQIAIVVASYWATLVEHNVPHDVADKLASEFQAKWLEVFWTKSK